MLNEGVLIAGGGLAAQRCCETLRKSGYEGRIRIVCEEAVAPYDRPPLSKGVLAGTQQPEEIVLRQPGWHPDNDVELLLGRSASALDAAAREVVLDDGSVLGYEQLLVATGARPRHLELTDGAQNAHCLRTAADARELRAALAPGARLVVIGGGFIGQEVAATARGLGAHVTLLEALDAPLVGLLGHQLGTWFADLHRAHGVDVRCGVTAVDAIREDDGHITALVLGDGHTLACDAIVVGIGVTPADEWLVESGIGGDGVECDDSGRTALPGVFAAGDVARTYDHFAGTHIRSEHWEAAGRQGAAAARAMLGLEARPGPPASFWSDQYDLRIQYLGYAPLADNVEIQGDLNGNDFIATWTRGGRPVAALLVGRPQELPRARKAIAQTLEHHQRQQELAA